MSKPQHLGNHAMYQPAWHYVAFPASSAFLVAAMVHWWRDRTSWNLWLIVGAVAIVAGVWASRIMALTVQDRVIRLEMRLRLREVLPASLHPRIGSLSRRQLIGLRFASDAELPALVERCLANELVTARAVKEQVRDWQADHLRA